MSTNKRPSLEKFTLPRGVFVWPKLNAPDTKFKAEGEYGVKARLSKAAAAPFLEKYAAAVDKSVAEARAKLEEAIKGAKGEKLAKARKALADLAPAESPIKPAFDDDGNETDEVVISVKMKASGVYKDGPKKGETWNRKPDIFNARGERLKNPPLIFGGSEGYVAGSFNPFYTEKAGAGVSLRLEAVKVVKLVSAGERDASAYGFGGEEEGWDGGDEETVPDGAGGEAGGEGGGADQSPDF